MFLLLFVRLNKQKNNKMQTLHSMLLCCCLLEGQDRVPHLCSACASVQGVERAPVFPGARSRCGSRFVLGAEGAQGSLRFRSSVPRSCRRARCRQGSAGGGRVAGAA